MADVPAFSGLVEPQRRLQPGDRLALNKSSGKWRLALPGDEGPSFTLPPRFTVSPAGLLEIRRQNCTVEVRGLTWAQALEEPR